MTSQASSSLTLALDVTSSSVPLQNDKRLLVPGFRFHPTEHELLSYYLVRKVSGKPLHTNVVPDIDIYGLEPYQVQGKVGGDIEWYFFSKLDKKYDTGERLNRSTKRGFWKVTGPEYKIKYGSQVIGEKRFLVYYDGHSKMGRRTDWVMHEYRLTEATCKMTRARDVYAVYRLFWKGNSSPLLNGPPPLAVERGKRVRNDNVAPADAALQASKELGLEAPEAAPADYALVIHKEAPLETLDLLTNLGGNRVYGHLEGTLPTRKGRPTRPVTGPRNAEADNPQNLSPRAQEPSSSNSVAGAATSLRLSLAYPASETLPEQQQPRPIAAPQPVPQQALEPPQTPLFPPRQRFA